MSKKIVILSTFLSPFRSGAEACAEEVPLALNEEFDFVIITAKLRRDLPRKDSLQGKIPVLRVGLGVPFDKWLFPFLAPFAAQNQKPDIIHAVLETFAGLALEFCRFMVPRAKRILTCQTTNRSFLKGVLIKAPHRVTVISSTLKEIVESCGRYDAVLIPNGIHVEQYREARSRCERKPGRILFVGRLERMKGLDTLITAFSSLPPGAHLRIVGEGSERQNLENLVTDLGIVDRVEFAGAVPSEQIALEYARAEIFCGLSRSEALGNVFLEAQAGGCAVLGTRIGGIPDSVEDRVTGILIEPDNAEAAANALQELLSDVELRGRLAQAGTDHAVQYDWEVIARQYAEVYGSIGVW